METTNMYDVLIDLALLMSVLLLRKLRYTIGTEARVHDATGAKDIR